MLNKNHFESFLKKDRKDFLYALHIKILFFVNFKEKKEIIPILKNTFFLLKIQEEQSEDLLKNSIKMKN